MWGSPYRSLFPNADYRRADFLRQEGDVLDYILDANSCVKEKDQTFDFILSTQVLEHVDDPRELHTGMPSLAQKRGSALHLYTWRLS